MVPEYNVKNQRKYRIYRKIAQISTLFCPNIANSQISGRATAPPAPLSRTPMHTGVGGGDQNNLILCLAYRPIRCACGHTKTLDP